MCTQLNQLSFYFLPCMRSGFGHDPLQTFSAIATSPRIKSELAGRTVCLPQWKSAGKPPQRRVLIGPFRLVGLGTGVSMKVFWSWQSETPGKIGRHFVRDALLLAIEALKQAPDVEEPTAAATREGLHLDHDRQGVSGDIRRRLQATYQFECRDRARALRSQADSPANCRRRAKSIERSMVMSPGRRMGFDFRV